MFDGIEDAGHTGPSERRTGSEEACRAALTPLPVARTDLRNARADAPTHVPQRHAYAELNGGWMRRIPLNPVRPEYSRECWSRQRPMAIRLARPAGAVDLTIRKAWRASPARWNRRRLHSWAATGPVAHDAEARPRPPTHATLCRRGEEHGI